MKKAKKWLCFNGVAIAPEPSAAEAVALRLEMAQRDIRVTLEKKPRAELRVYWSARIKEFVALFYGIDGVPENRLWDALFFRESNYWRYWEHGSILRNYQPGKRVAWDELNAGCKNLLLAEIKEIRWEKCHENG